MIKWFFPQHLSQKGQTAVEYILLLLVMVSIITSLLSVIKNKYLGDPKACESTQNRAKILCKISSYLEPRDGSKHFQYYPFKK